MYQAPGSAFPPPVTPWSGWRVLQWLMMVMAIGFLVFAVVAPNRTQPATPSGYRAWDEPLLRNYGETYTPGYSIFITIDRPVCQASGDCKAKVKIVNHSDRYPYQLDYHTVSSPTTETTTSGMWDYPLWPGREWTYSVSFKGTPDTPLTFTPASATQVSLPPGLDMRTKVTWE